MSLLSVQDPTTRPMLPTLEFSCDGQRGAIPAGHFFTVGRSGNVDLAVRLPIVSRRHLVIGYKNGWFVEDLGSGNGSYVEGRRIERHLITGTTQVRLGDPGTGPILLLEPDPAGALAAQESLELTATGRRISAGQLARLFPHLGAPPWLEAPPGLPVPSGLRGIAAGPPPPVHGDEAVLLRSVGAPPSLIVPGWLGGLPDPVSGTGLSTPAPSPGATDGLQIRGLGFRVENGKQLLRDISFDAPRGTLTAIVGPSGAGKSTFAKSVSGLTKPSDGSVKFDGIDVHRSYDTAKTLIGMVPQEDVIHNQLTLVRALRFAATRPVLPSRRIWNRSSLCSMSGSVSARRRLVSSSTAIVS